MFWIINDNIKFCPDKNVLVSLNKPELSVILTTPASRCLALLLESSPEVVNQKEFFDKVWGEDGMIVPANTLYQNISIIRRGLRSAGETSDTLVATVPRKGFQIHKSVKVTRVETDGVDTEEPAEVSLPEAPLTVPVEQPAVNTSQVLVEKKSPRKLRRLFFPVLLMIISFALGYFMLHHIFRDNPDKDFFQNYTINRTENGCHYFSQSDDIKSIGNFSRFIKIIMKTGLDCKKYPWIYFSSSSNAPALSVLACRKPYEAEPNAECTTLYFRGYMQ